MNFVLVIACVVLPVAARAGEREVAHSLTVEQAVATALTENPQLRAMRLKWEAMRERPVQATTLPNPMLKYGGMDRADRGHWPDTEEKRFMLEQEFPWPGKLGLRGKVATKEAEAIQHEYEARQRDVVMMVKENYFDLYAVQCSRTITRAEEDVLQRMTKIAETMYATGARPQQDALKAQAELTMLKQKLLELEQQEVTLQAKLNQLLNRPAEAPIGLAVTMPAGDFDFQAAGPRPEIKKAEADLQRSEYERALMKKEFWPDYRLGLEYRSFRSAEDMVMFTVGIDLPIWQTKYRAGVREAERMIESARAAKEAVERQVGFDVRDAQFKLLTARRTLELYRTALIPQAEARFAASEAGYRTGQVDFMDLLESQRFLLSARVMAAMAEGNVGRQTARLERAIGAELKETK